MKRTLFTIALSLLMAGTFFAQTPQTGQATRTAGAAHTGKGSPKESPRINLSIWKNLATQHTDTVGSTWLNLGIFSSVNRLQGAGINVLGGVVGRDACGIQAGGLANMTGGSMKGIQAAGISNVNGDGLAGISLSGLVGITGDHARGLLASGLANISGSKSRGITLAGLLNVTGENATGCTFSGMANLSGKELRGASVAGLMNVASGKATGIQCSGLVNITAEDMAGVQLSGIGNVAGGRAKGVQISLANMAARVKGLQIGLFNYYKDSLEGFQLGLVNANPHTRIEPMLFAGTATKLNLGVRFRNKLYYTILGGGTHYLEFGDKFSASFFYRAGLELPLHKQWFLSGDLGYQHIETFKNKRYGIPARLYALQARLNLEYRPGGNLGYFITGGYGGSRYYTRGVTYDKGVIVEGGVAWLYKSKQISHKK